MVLSATIVPNNLEYCFSKDILALIKRNNLMAGTACRRHVSLDK